MSHFVKLTAVLTCGLAATLAWAQQTPPPSTPPAPANPPAAKPAEPAKPAQPGQPAQATGHEGHDHGAPVQVTPLPVTPGAPANPGVPTPNPDPNAPQPKMELSSTAWNFGEVWAGQDLEYEITVKNTGKAPLHTMVKSSCGCTSTKKPKEVLEPGESDTLKIGYNTKKRSGKANQTVTINTNDPTQPTVTIKVEGDVKSVYQADPPTFAFSRLGRTSQETKKVTITNTYTEKMNLKIKGEVKGPFDVQLKEIEPGMKWELTATTKPPLELGVARADVNLETGLAIMPEINFPVQGYVQPPVQISPTVLYVPAQSPQQMERIVRVTWVGDKPLGIKEIKCTSDKITAKVSPPPANQPAQTGMGAHDIRVTLPPAAEIPESGATLEITTDSDDPQYKTLKVEVTTRRPGPAAVNPAGALSPTAAGAGATAAPTAPGATATPAKPATPAPATPNTPAPATPGTGAQKP